MRAIIAEMAEAVRHGSSASSIEEICRFAVAQAMEDEDRLLFDEEIADIVEPTVKDETMADPAAVIDGDQAILNENEWNSLDEESKAIDKEGRLYVISGGRLYEAEITEDPSAARIASAISFDIEAALTAKSIQDGCTYDLASFHLNAEEVERTCPLCGSPNTSVVWYDKQVVVNHCHDCEEDFETPMDPDTATAEELTTEEFELSDGNSAFTWYDEEGWHLEIDEPDGTLVHMFDISDPDEAESLMDGYESGEFDVEPGEVLKSIENGNELEIESIDGKAAYVGGRRASVSSLKVSKMLGRFVSDKSACAGHMRIMAGDMYENDLGDRLTIESIEDEDVIYSEVTINKQSGLTQDITARCGKFEFMDVLEKGNYVEF